MSTTTPIVSRSAQQARWLLQVGLLLFLCALLVGILIPRFGIPRLGLSAHLLGLLQGMFLIVVSLVWPGLSFGRTASWVAFWLLIYGCLSAWLANILAGVWSAGSALLPLAAGSARGSMLEEAIIAIGLRSAAVALLAALAMLIWGTFGTRGTDSSERG
jgi:hydroxylaminobenzene mutase